MNRTVFNFDYRTKEIFVRVMAFILAFSMTLSCCPLSVVADGTDDQDGSVYIETEGQGNNDGIIISVDTPDVGNVDSGESEGSDYENSQNSESDENSANIHQEVPEETEVPEIETPVETKTPEIENLEETGTTEIENPEETEPQDNNEQTGIIENNGTQNEDSAAGDNYTLEDGNAADTTGPVEENVINDSNEAITNTDIEIRFDSVFAKKDDDSISTIDITRDIQLPVSDDVTGYGIVLGWNITSDEAHKDEYVNFNITFPYYFTNLEIAEAIPEELELESILEKDSGFYANVTKEDGTYTLSVNSLPGAGKICLVFDSIAATAAVHLYDGEISDENPLYIFAVKSDIDEEYSDEAISDLYDDYENLSEEELQKLTEMYGELTVTMEESTDTLPDISYITLSGNVGYSGDDDWYEITRPSTFNSAITITAYYTDEAENTCLKECPAQIEAYDQDFYLMLARNEDGTADYQIVNVPNKINTESGYKEVAYYRISVAAPTASYSSTSTGDILIKSTTGSIIAQVVVPDISLTMQTTTMTVNSTVVGASSVNFDTTLVFSNPGISTAESSISKQVSTSSNGTFVTVPVGVTLVSAQQTEKSGYKLVQDYTVTISAEDGTTHQEAIDSNCTVTNPIMSNVTIESTNYAHNVKYHVNVTWIDNNSSSRPAETLDRYLCLQYYREPGEGETEGTWVTVDSDSLEALGVSNLPVWNGAESCYENLPAANAAGQLVKYRVVPRNDNSVPSAFDKYICEGSYAENDTCAVYTLTEKTKFNATVAWKDGGYSTFRPNDIASLGLKLYRRIEGGEYEQVKINGADVSLIADTTTDPNNWKITTADGVELPRYDTSNREYDYVILQENTITEQSSGDRYETIYSNSSGISAQDESRCHNGGTIIEKRSGNTTYTATKVWKDGNSSDRPTNTTVTLWRYTRMTSTDTYDITEEHFEKASQVVYRGTDNKDHAVTMTLTGRDSESNLENEEIISFTLPDGASLPKYDENGLEYVYFVRELVDDKYEVVYEFTTTGSDGNSSTVSESGARNGGRVSNVRREKAQVTVSKQWKCPANLSDIDGVSVTMKMAAHCGICGEWHDLTVYSSEPGSYEHAENQYLTISGFEQNIATLDGTFYVNIYDSEGHPIDMSNAKVVELNIQKNGETIDTVEYANSNYNNPGSFEIGTDMFKSESVSKATGNENGGFGEKTFAYDLGNTITGTVKYTMYKQWQGMNPDHIEYDNKDWKAVSVSYALYRESTGPNSTKEQIHCSEEQELWDVDYKESLAWANQYDLDKYDPDGYLYYYYAEERQVTLANNDESGETVTGIPDQFGMSTYTTHGDNWSRVLNGKWDSSGPVMHFTKSWVDNGDIEARNDVYIRVYSKEQLSGALDALEAVEAADISLDSLKTQDGKDLPYYQLTITKEGLYWYAEVAILGENRIKDTIYGTKDKWSEDESPKRGDQCTDYVALEYKIGIDGTSAEYSVEQLRSAAGETSINEIYASGNVAGTNRRYDVKAVWTSANGVEFTNTRKGDADITIKKTWKDTDPTSRPDYIYFQIYRDGVSIDPKTENITIYKEGTTEQINYSVNNLYRYIRKENPEDPEHPTYEPVFAGYKVGLPVSKVKGSDGQYYVETYKINGLPLFNELGAQYTYNVAEIGLVDKYISMPDGPTVEADENIPDYLKYYFGYTNTRTDMTSITAYKVWNDIATGGKDRPDLIFTVWQYLDVNGDGKDNDTIGETPISWVKYNDSRDPSLFTQGLSADETAKGYNWKIYKDQLPAYDAQGRPYLYKFTEGFKGNNETQASNAYGTYIQTANRTEKINGKTVQVFENTLTNTMDVKGTKVWKIDSQYHINVSDPTQLPNATIKLYRTTMTSDIPNLLADDVTQETINNLVANNIIEVVYEKGSNGNDAQLQMACLLTGNNKYSYSFEGLEKYSPTGEKYTYLLWETMDDNNVVDQLYTQVSVTGTLTNTLKSNVNRRTITVVKNWDNRPESEKYPSVTFELYRYIQNNTSDSVPSINAVKANAEKIDSVKIPASYFTSAANGTTTFAAPADYTGAGVSITAEQGIISCTFTDLLTYSPKGELYGYYVVEKPVNGYSISYIDENGVNNVTNESDVTTNPGINYTEKPNSVVSTVNTYDNYGRLTLKGTKNWQDYGNSSVFASMRPNTITLTLHRYTGSESGQGNNIGTSSQTVEVTFDDDHVLYAEPETAPTGPYIIWTSTEENSWSYKIRNLEKYGPNGQQYTYIVSEEPVSGYIVTPEKVTVGTDKIENQSDYRATLTNKFDGKYTVRKNWMDGDDLYNLRPNGVTFVLERSIDDSAWTTIDITSEADKSNLKTDNNGNIWFYDLPCVQYQEKWVVGVKLTAADVIRNTNGSSWKYTFINLPVKNNEGKNWCYRAREVKIGNTDLLYDYSTGKTGAGAYSLTKTEHNAAGTQTTAQNELNATTLILTKNWAMDTDNYYYSRPSSITFNLQYALKMRDTESSNDVYLTDENGNVLWTTISMNDSNIISLTGGQNDSTWTKTLSNLPTVVQYNGTDKFPFINGEYYTAEYRALERTVTDERVDGAKNYDARNFEVTSESAADGDHYTSTITNQLITDTNITVTKVWQRQPGEAVTATFELLWHKKSEGEGVWHCFTAPTVSGSTWLNVSHSQSNHTGSADGCSVHNPANGCLQKTTQPSTVAGEDTTVTWTNLPKYDREGNKLEYKVIEFAVDGYKTVEGTVAHTQGTPAITADPDNNVQATPAINAVDNYTFTNIELQSYSVEKIWQNTAYSAKDTNGYTATFVLQQQTQTGVDSTTYSEWSNVKDANNQDLEVTLTTVVSGDTAAQNTALKHTWTNLPKYTAAGEQIIYRAVETKINGKTVNTSNYTEDYAVSYKYDGNIDPAFAGTTTEATNRMVYGYVNLAKSAAYLAPKVTPTGSNLGDVVFEILDSRDQHYLTVTTDSNGHIPLNEDGTYGTEHKYLIAGTYTIREKTPNPNFSKWNQGVQFTVGTVGGTTDTGEHGTAWIYTEQNIIQQIFGGVSLQAQYIHQDPTITHSYTDNCIPNTTEDAPAYNIESRGVVTFTKTGPSTSNGTTALDTHDSAVGESSAYFGIYVTVNGTKTQVAGMVADSSKNNFVLTNIAQDRTTALAEVNNNAGIPYLRAYGHTYTLLSGEYTIEEIVAPPGYILDTTVRTLTIPEITTTDVSSNSDLTAVYSSNQGKITGLTNNQWPNTPNKVQIYKLDQYGRKVNLNANGCLILTVSGEGNTFKSGENIIKLYQSGNMPATKNDGITSVNGITYENGVWTVTGLFDINHTYTLSEPEEAVPGENVIAEQISFQIDNKGTLKQVSGATSSGTPTEADGNEYANYYKADAAANTLVLRDVARYQLICIEKKDFITKTKQIPNISFKLCKKTGTTWRSVLEEGQYLTTDTEGKIDLANITLTNTFTHQQLKYGLEIGEYMLQEVERGAADSYRLMEVYFTVRSNAGSNKTTDYSDYATVKYNTNDHVVQDTTNSSKATVYNDPVTTKPKTLIVTKVAGDNNQRKVAGARFKLTYKSDTDNQDGSAGTWTKYGITDEEGILCEAVDWSIVQIESQNVHLDISMKGTYTLTEIQAPGDGMPNYITPTPKLQIKFGVDEKNSIVEVKILPEDTTLITNPQTNVDTNEYTGLTVSFINNRTVVNIQKLSDIAGNVKNSNYTTADGSQLPGAKLEIYEEGGGDVWKLYPGPDDSDVTLQEYLSKLISEDHHAIISVNDEGTVWTLTGVLKENTVYRLHEVAAPMGYLTAPDIYFKLYSGTTAEATVSKLYVWNGEGSVTVDGSGWSETQNIRDAALSMVDEAVIAPIAIPKVVGTADSNTPLAGAEFSVKDNTTNTVLGTAVTTATGLLNWKTVDNVSQNQIFYINNNKAAIAQTSSDAAEKPVILQKNANGYTFTETYAPDNAYMSKLVYTVKISDQNYLDYKANGYNTDKAVNAVEANAENTKEAALSVLPVTGNSLAINQAYKSTVTLHKYDADIEANKSLIAGAQFTLYKAKQENGIWVIDYSTAPVTADGQVTYTTDSSGNISITVTRKGEYILKETKAAKGYVLGNTPFEIHFTLQDDATAADKANKIFGYDQTNVLKPDDDTTGVPNDREYGTIEITKRGAYGTLNDVKFELTRISSIESYNNEGTAVTSTTYNFGTFEIYSGHSYDFSYNSTNSKWTCTVTSSVHDSHNDGKLIITGLDWGTYKLEEIQENTGYVKDSNNVYTFTVDRTLNPAVTGNGAENNTISNQRNEITLKKTNLDGTVLAGAVFDIHVGSAENCGSGCTSAVYYSSNDAQDRATSVTSGTDGTVKIYGLETDINSDTPRVYHLVETTAPEGYEIAEPMQFTIDRNGNVNGITDRTVTMQDRPIELTLEKWDSSGGAILKQATYGYAKFTLKGRFANETTDRTTPELSMDLARRDQTEAPFYLPDYLKAKLVAGRTYTITETYAPDGYELESREATLSVASDGKITVSSDDTGFIRTDNSSADGVAKITYDNFRIQLSLTKQDADDSNKKLSDVQFRITPEEGSSFAPYYGITDNSVVVTTDESGVANIPELLLKYNNSYVLTEISLGDNKTYRLAENEADRQITFKVNNDGTAEITSTNPFFNIDENDATHFVIVNDPIEIEISKIDDETKEPIEGVTLHLNKVNSAGEIITRAEDVTGWDWTTNVVEGKNSHIISNLEPGIYCITENAIDGYIQIPTVYFKLEANGSVVRTDKSGTAFTTENAQPGTETVMNITGPVDGARNSHATLILENHKNKLTITKTDIGGKQLSKENLVNEATFQILNSNNTALKFVYNSNLTQYEYSTMENATAEIFAGEAVIRGIPSGDYTLKEAIAPAGYELTADITFSVDAYGVFSVTAPNGENTNYVFTSSEDGGILRSGDLVVKDTPIEVSIRKLGETDSEELTGAIFTLTDICEDCEATGKFADKTTECSVTVSDIAGVKIPVETLIAGHTYQLEETTAPDGYKCTVKVEFTVDSDGKVTIVSSEGCYIPEGQTSGVSLNQESDQITIRDEKIRVNLLKVDADNPEIKLQGVDFKLRPYTAKESSDVSAFMNPLPSGISLTEDGEYLLTTDTNGSAVIPGGLLLQDNSYELIETSIGSNSSYRFDSEETNRHVLFKVEKDGTLTILEGTSLIFGLGDSITSDPITLNLRNEKIKLTIAKIDEATCSALEGVKFRLTGPIESQTFVWTTGTSGKITLQTGSAAAQNNGPDFKAGTTSEPGDDTDATLDSENPSEIVITAGTYTLEELESPDSHNQLTRRVTFTVDADGEITITNDQNNPELSFYSATGVITGTTGYMTLTVENPANSKLIINKKDPAGNGLNGVKFTVEYASAVNDTYSYVVKDETTTDNPNDIKVSDHKPDSGSSVVGATWTTSGGALSIENMPDGYYRITEIQTVAGYNLLSGPIYVCIDRVNGNSWMKSATDTATDINQNESDKDEYVITVYNRKGFALPATGVITPTLSPIVLIVVGLAEALVLTKYAKRTKKRRTQ